nr:hypothetical protein [Tanacetum cinerariifolium]
QTPGSGISNLLAVGTTFTGSENLYCQWELSPGSGNALCILFPIETFRLTHFLYHSSTNSLAGGSPFFWQWEHLPLAVENYTASGNSLLAVKDKQEKDEIGSKPDKNGRRSVKDKILIPKLPENCARCAKCGHPVNGHYCQGCALAREKLEEDLVTYFQNFQNISESSDDSTNVVNAPREPIVVKTDHGVNPLHIDKCCCECGDALDGIFCQ